MGQIKTLATFLRVVLCSQAAILYSKFQFLSDSSRVPFIRSLIPLRRSLSTKLIVSVITHFCYAA